MLGELLGEVDALGRRMDTAVVLPKPKPCPSAGCWLLAAADALALAQDDYRAMHAAYGWSQPHLPNADAFAKESLVFDRAFVQQAVCG